MELADPKKSDAAMVNPAILIRSFQHFGSFELWYLSVFQRLLYCPYLFAFCAESAWTVLKTLLSHRPQIRIKGEFNKPIHGALLAVTNALWFDVE